MMGWWGSEFWWVGGVGSWIKGLVGLFGAILLISSIIFDFFLSSSPSLDEAQIRGH